MKRQFKISVDAPADVSDAELVEYIEDAVASWKGQFHPEEPLFHLDGDSVKVTYLRRAKAEDT